MTGKIICAMLILVFCNTNAQDLSLREDSQGALVVKDALQRLEKLTIFPEDYGYLRRVAWVESNDGAKKAKENNGGIWQVDPFDFEDTKTNPIAKSRIHPKLQQQLGFEWATTTYDELRKPFFSLIAARIKLFITTVPPMCTKPTPRSPDDQAQYWKLCYNRFAVGDRSAEHFLEMLNNLPKPPKR